MSGAKNGMPTQILKEEKRTVYTHCYGHALNVAAGDSVSKSAVLSKVCSINFEPLDEDLCSACHVYPLSRGA